MNPFSLQIFANQPGITHAVFNRHGGVSPQPFANLNLSFGVQDDPKLVLANRQRVKESLDVEYLASAQQIHGDRILLVDRLPSNGQEADGFDALLTKLPNLGLMIQQADCQAIMLFDPVKKAIANIHSGWKGTTLNIIGKTVEAMVENFSSEPNDLLAGISPSLGPCCAEFINYTTELPTNLHKFQTKPNYFDFWAISHEQLLGAGLKERHIEIAKICTMCDHDYFSYRRNKITGRFASVIALN